MHIQTLRTFLAAATTGSFAGAASRVHISASSVTERIQQLEHMLGARLFVRDKSGCRLTPAGRRFVEPATKAVRAWDMARHDVALPEKFTQSVSLGGQTALWANFLIPWLSTARKAFATTAFRVTAGASARLNRDLHDGALDLTVLYDPIFRREMAAEKLFDDDLVMVTGGDPDEWRNNYARIDWGEALGPEIGAQIDVTPTTGLVLDLGLHAANWLVTQQMAGFMPRRLVKSQIDSGALHPVPDMPEFAYPAYICWRRDFDPALAADLVQSLIEFERGEVPIC